MSRDLKILSASMFLWGFGEGLFLIFQPLYIQQLGAAPILIGTILGLNGLVMTFSQIPSGLLADKIGRRPLIWFSFFAGVVATWIMALAPALPMFVVGLFLYGFTSSVMAPLNTYVQAARGSWSVGRSITFISAMYNAGMIMGPIVGGIISSNINLRAIYHVAAIIFTLSSVVVAFLRKQPVEQNSGHDRDEHLFKNRRFIGLSLIILVSMFAVTLPQPLAANFLQNNRNLNFNQIGRLGAVNALGSVLLMLVFGHVPSGIAILIGQVCVLLFAILLWRGNNTVLFGIAYFFLGGYKLSRAMTVALVRPVVRVWEIGLAFGVVETLNSLALMLAPVVAGYLYDWQPASIFKVGAGAILLSSIFSAGFFYRHNYHSEEPVEQAVCGGDEYYEA
ncbi:MAG: MFS transporter [Brevefilum sp.]